MDDKKEFVQVLAAVMGVQDQGELEQGIKDLGEDGLRAMYETYKKVKNMGEEGFKQLKTMYETYKHAKDMEGHKQLKSADSEIMESKTTYAKLGAKLNYIKQLRGECPEGYEIEKYLAGGCVTCRKKMKEGASVVERFKSEKCGGKMKKTKKAQTGAPIVPRNSEKGKLKKCGGKMKKVKKNYFGGILDKWL